MRILLVDDEEELVSALGERLALRGLTVDWTSSGRTALAWAGERPYDVAVLDIKMPGLSGLELRRRLLAIQPDLPCIFMTGHGSAGAGDEAEAVAAGGGCLPKPVRLDELLARLREVAA